MYHKILVPLDGSELAEVTLWYAARLAVRLRSSVTLVYVTSPDELPSPHLYECYLRDVIVRMKEVAAKVAAVKSDGDISVEYKVLKCDPAEEIVDYADRAKIDLIILSTQGKSGIKRWALSNVANKVVRATRKQVLLIRAKGAKSDVYKDSLTKVLVPVDGSKGSESILKFTNYLAAELNLAVTLLHMWVHEYELYPTEVKLREIQRDRKRGNDYVNRLGARLSKKGLNVDSVFAEVFRGREAEEIIKLAEEGNFSMVAMATHGRSGVGRWIFGSNADKVLNEGSTPLLLVRPAKRKTKAD